MKIISSPSAAALCISTLCLIAGLALLSVAREAAASASATNASNANIDEAVRTALKELPDYIKQVMEKTGVPGVAVAVVHDDKLVYAEGFGVRSTDTGAAVTPDTVFQIASVSKPLGATAVAAAISSGALTWDTPVANLVPQVSLSNAEVWSRVTIGDLYAHRSGLPGDFGNDLEQFGYDRDYIFRQAHLEPLSPFRETFSYSNFGLTVAGVAAATASGMKWDEFANKFVFSPLGMSNSTYNHADFKAMENTATLHQKVEGRWMPGTERNADAQAPAGGANSTVLDLSRWMRMLLSEGNIDGNRIVSEEALNPMLALQIKTAADTSEGSTGYGFGMGVDVDKQGKVTWTHSGAFTNGASTQIYLEPELELGIVTLTNGWPVGVPEAINATFVDLVKFGKPTRDWFSVTDEAFAPYTQITYSIDGKAKPTQPNPAGDLKSYVGRFSSNYTGEAMVSLGEQGLLLTLGPEGKTQLPLRHWDADVFYFNGIGLPEGFYAAVRFTRDNEGDVNSFRIDEVNSGLGIFTRTQ